jgi:hypothetical protein
VESISEDEEHEQQEEEGKPLVLDCGFAEVFGGFLSMCYSAAVGFGPFNEKEEELVAALVPAAVRALKDETTSSCIRSRIIFYDPRIRPQFQQNDQGRSFAKKLQEVSFESSSFLSLSLFCG